MNGTDIVKLAVDLGTGAITASAIEEMYGEGVLGSVLALAGGSIAGVAAHGALNVIDQHTGIVSDVGSLIDDVFDLF
jgi:hypothetical protein